MTWPPNFRIPGLWQGLLGRGLDENASHVQLSDGGHFDNTGLYELLCRCRGCGRRDQFRRSGYHVIAPQPSTGAGIAAGSQKNSHCTPAAQLTVLANPASTKSGSVVQHTSEPVVFAPASSCNSSCALRSIGTALYLRLESRLTIRERHA